MNKCVENYKNKQVRYNKNRSEIDDTPYASPSGCKKAGNPLVLRVVVEIHSVTTSNRPSPLTQHERQKLAIFNRGTTETFVASISQHSAVL